MRWSSKDARDSAEHEFTRASSVRALPDGRGLVIDSRERALSVADFASGAVEQAGRTGRGSAEYERPTRLITVGADSTRLVDPGNRRYDSSTGCPNPYAKLSKKPVTIRLDTSTVDDFKALAEEAELPYQSLTNRYLRDCAAHGRRLSMSWRGENAAAA